MKMKREQIVKYIFTNGKCELVIRSQIHFENNYHGHGLCNGDDEAVLEEHEITENVLKMISEAYYAGYTQANEDAKDAVSRIILEKSRPCKPKPKISEVEDYRNMNRKAEDIK